MLGSGGEPESFEDAFDEIFHVAFLVGRRILHDPHDAQDIAAETSARALAQWRKIGAVPYRAAWVSRVAANLAVDQVRKRRHRGETVRPAVSAPEQLPDDELALLLGTLPRRQREVLALRYVVDLPDAEIATALGISAGSVKKHAARGLASLRERLAPPTSGVSVAY